MDIQQATDFVQRERTRWPFLLHGGSDLEFLRRNERFFNGLTMTFGLVVLVSAFAAGLFGWGIWGWYISVFGAAFIARWCSAHADRCGEARELLKRADPNANYEVSK